MYSPTTGEVTGNSGESSNPSFFFFFFFIHNCIMIFTRKLHFLKLTNGFTVDFSRAIEMFSLCSAVNTAG